MALVLKDRVRETSLTGGTGTLTLNGAVPGFQAFSVIGNTNTTYYAIVDNATGEFEVGLGTYTLSGTTLSRDSILESSSGGSAINFTGNIKDVFCTYPAERSVYVDGSGIVPATAATLGVASGGTGITSFGTGVATFLGTPSSANLAAAVTDETGSGALVFATSPTLVTPALGTPASGVVTNLTGTASININGTVGATTASTGAFTTLTTSSTVTHNGGTANGVAFLNASKVLTTGSGFNTDGTNIGIGVGATSGQRVYARTATDTGTAYLADNSVNTGFIVRFEPNTTLIGNDFNNPLAFLQNNAEQMRLTSTGLGIGTSSPGARLDVRGGKIQLIGAAGGGAGGGFLSGEVPSEFHIQSEDYTGATFADIVFDAGNGSGSIIERMRIDSAGTITFNAYGAGTLSTSASGVISASDGRYKTKTREVTSGLEAIVALQPTYFRWNEDSPFASEYEELGFVAQEVAAVIPEASPGEDEEGKYRNYHDRAIIAMLVKGMQEQQTLITTLTARVAALESN